MPPKIPIRIVPKAPPISKSRSTPLHPRLPKAAPREAPKPHSSRPKTEFTPPPPRTSWNRSLRFGARIGGYYILFVCVGLWTRDHYIHYTTVQGVSMAPTINPTVHETGQKDWILVRPYLHRNVKKLEQNNELAIEDKDNDPWGVKRGDVVTFWKPHKPEELGIKRVVAIEGDFVYPKRGYALDTKVLSQQRLQGMPDGLPENDPDSIASERQEAGRIVVPYGHIWVEGDNSRSSLDSRDYGPISKGLVVGKAVWTWRGWGEIFRTGDARSKREKELGSRVVKGRSEIPAVFLE